MWPTPVQKTQRCRKSLRSRTHSPAESESESEAVPRIKPNHATAKRLQDGSSCLGVRHVDSAFQDRVRIQSVEHVRSDRQTTVHRHRECFGQPNIQHVEVWIAKVNRRVRVVIPLLSV